MCLPGISKPSEFGRKSAEGAIPTSRSPLLPHTLQKEATKDLRSAYVYELAPHLVSLTPAIEACDIMMENFDLWMALWTAFRN